MTLNSLPVFEYRQSILEAARLNQVTLVVGPTGSGKTTQVPQFLLDGGFASRGLVVCTEPKRIAAMSVAARVASERNQELGQDVGYVIRFDWNLTEATKLLYVTCGILLQTAISDPLLSKYSCVIVDEAHQRDLFTDFLLGYLKRICQQRPDFRLVIMSATLQHRELLQYFPGAKLVVIRERQFPIGLSYAPSGKDLIGAVVATVSQIHSATPAGDVLVFLPGVREIRELIERLDQMQLRGVKLLPLYGGLDPRQQRLVFQRFPERKIIVATNIAESSITIDNVSYVIDSGLAKEEGFDPYVGMKTLELQPISQDASQQRMGRTGRVGPGTCIRLYSEDDYRRRPLYAAAAIVRSDLSELLLTIRSLGIREREFDFLTMPADEQWEHAQQTLENYGVLSEAETVTEYGQQLARLALELKLARFVLVSTEYGCVVEAVTIAAMLTVGRFFTRELYEEEEFQFLKQQLEDPDSDFITLLNIWDAYDVALDPIQWCREHRINQFWMQGVRKIRQQTFQRLDELGIPATTSRNRDLLDLAITAGFKENALRFRHDDTYLNLRGMPVYLSRDSVLAERNPQYAVCYELTGNSRVYANCVHQVKHEVVTEAAPQALDLRPTASDQSTKAVRLQGELTVEVGNRTRLVKVDVDLARSMSYEVRAVNRGQILIEEPRFSLQLLGLSATAQEDLAEANITSLAELPNSGQELAEQGVSYRVVREVLGALAPLGYIRKSSPVPQKRLAQRPGVVLTESGLAPDRLATAFLQQPIEALKLSGRALMVLWGIDVKKVEDLTTQTEKELLERIKEYSKKGSRGTGWREINGKDVIQEVKARLMHFELRLKQEKSLGLQFNPELLSARLPPADPADEERAIDMLGAWYPYFKVVRETPPGDDDRIFCRNLIVEANLGLPGRFCRNVYYYWHMVDDPMLAYEDLFQEGCLGLIWGTEKYDYTRGAKYSTYVVPWITKNVFRAVDNASIMPVHVIDKLRKMGARYRRLTKMLGAEPTRDEFAAYVGKSERQVEMFFAELQFWKHFISLDQPTKGGNDESEGSALIDLQEAPDEGLDENIDQRKLRTVMERILNESVLQDVDKEVLILRHGLFGHRPHSLEEVGEYLGVTRERVRQREERALEQLRTMQVWEQVEEFMPSLPIPSSREHEFSVDDSGKVLRRKVSSLKVKPEKPPTVEEILDSVARCYDLTREELLDPKRKDDRVVIPRHMAMHILHFDGKRNYVEIGELFGVSKQRIHQLLSTSTRLQEDAQRVIDSMRQTRDGKEVEVASQTPSVSSNDLTVNQVLDVVAHHFQVTRQDLLGIHRDKEVVAPRHVAMLLLRMELDMSYPEIGEVFGGRDHTSVLYACRKIAGEIHKVPESRGVFEVLRQRLQSLKGGPA